MKIISDSSLVCFLEDLRHALENFDAKETRNIIFINIDAFYSYIQQTNPANRSNLEELMNVVEPFIPLVISDHNIQSLLEAAGKGDDYELTSLENTFINKSKLRFIDSIISAESTEDWQKITGICRTIRSYKAQNS